MATARKRNRGSERPTPIVQESLHSPTLRTASDTTCALPAAAVTVIAISPKNCHSYLGGARSTTRKTRGTERSDAQHVFVFLPQPLPAWFPHAWHPLRLQSPLASTVNKGAASMKRASRRVPSFPSCSNVQASQDYSPNACVY